MIEDFDGRLMEVDELKALKNYHGAIEILNALSQEFSQRYEIFEKRSEIYRRLGDIDAAYIDLQRVMQLSPNELAPYFRRARWKIEERKYNDAVEDLTKVIEAKSGYFLESAYFLRALCYVRTGQFEVAWQDCMHVDDQFSLGPILGSKRDLIEAIGRSIDLSRVR